MEASLIGTFFLDGIGLLVFAPVDTRVCLHYRQGSRRS
jgi:hypothetical protein